MLGIASQEVSGVKWRRGMSFQKLPRNFSSWGSLLILMPLVPFFIEYLMFTKTNMEIVMPLVQEIT